MDANNDGFEDILMYSSANGNQLSALSNGLGGFTTTSAYWGAGRVMTVQNPVGSFQTFTNCLSGNGHGGAIPPVCTIPTGTYTLTSPIVVGRSNVTIRGGSGNRSQTMLVRDPNNTAPLVTVGDYPSTPLTGITIENLTVCGAAR